MNEADPGARAWTIPAILSGLGVLCVAGGPLVFSTGMRDAFVLVKLLPLAIGVLLLWSSAALAGRSPWKGRSLGLPLAAVWAVLAASALLSVDLGLSLFGPHQQQFLAILPLALCTLAYLGAAGRLSSLAAGRLVLGVAVAASFIAVAQKVGAIHALDFSVQSGRVGSTFGSPIFLGAFLALALPLAVGEILEGARAEGAASLLLLVLGLVAAGSRGGLLAGGAGVGLYLALRGVWRWNSYMVAILALATAGVVLFGHGSRSDSDVGRFEVWRIAFSAWRQFPVLGWGPDTFPIAFHRLMTDRFVEVTHNDFTIQMSAHNDFLQALATVGLAGLAAYAAILLAVARLARLALPARGAAAAAAALFALFVQAKVNPIPVSVLACATLLVASFETGFATEPKPHAQAPVWGGAVLALGMLVLVGRFCAAEVYQARGAAKSSAYAAIDDLGRAAKMNPGDLFYLQAQFNAIYTALPAMNSDQRRGAAMAFLDLSARAVALHPNDPTSHEMRAVALKTSTALLGVNLMGQTQSEIRIAQTQAPKYSGYRWQEKHLNDFLAQNTAANPRETVLGKPLEKTR
jgi:O-antigen ligase